MMMNKYQKAKKIISITFDPLILWCHGWKRRKVFWHRLILRKQGKHVQWKDPEDKIWYKQETAIAICEKRINERR